MKLLTTMLLIVFGLIQGFAQDVPQAVKKAFAEKYPKIKKVEWEKEGKNYEAEFNVQQRENEVVFDAQGNILQVEKELKLSELSLTIKNFVQQNYEGAKLEEAAKINRQGTILYEVELKHNNKEVELIFDQQGNKIGEKMGEETEENND